ncbi:MAG: IS5 family transposase [Bacteroidota bacterium]
MSDYEVEDRINDSLSFSYFCGMSIDQVAPDHSTISRFRTLMTQKGAYEELFRSINAQLEAHGIIVKTGALVDSSIVDTPLKPKGSSRYEVLDQDKQEDAIVDQPVEVKKDIAPSVDTEEAWVKKAGKLRYGYKKYHLTDDEGMIMGLLTTPANVNEISNLEEVLDTVNLPEGTTLKADKGYQSQKNSEILQRRKLKNHIMKKAKRNKTLTPWEKKFNNLIGKTRFNVERSFGSINRWFSGGVARYRGLEKMHTQNLMEAICHNLYLSPGIIASNGV